jgi:hypothetical protein
LHTCREEPGEGEEDPPETAGHPEVVDENEDGGAEETVLTLAGGGEAAPGHQLVLIGGHGGLAWPLEAAGYSLYARTTFTVV